jgi:hypothetical protein
LWFCGLSLRTKLKPINDEDFSILHDYALKNGSESKLQIYDIDYWKNKHFVETYG